MQEYDFTIEYRKGALNANADALLRCVNQSNVAAATQIQTNQSKDELLAAQQNDPIVQEISLNQLKHP